MVLPRGPKINNYARSFLSKWLIWGAGWWLSWSLFALVCCLMLCFQKGVFAYLGLRLFSLIFASPDFCPGVLSTSMGLVHAA